MSHVRLWVVYSTYLRTSANIVLYARRQRQTPRRRLCSGHHVISRKAVGVRRGPRHTLVVVVTCAVRTAVSRVAKRCGREATVLRKLIKLIRVRFRFESATRIPQHTRNRFRSLRFSLAPHCVNTVIDVCCSFHDVLRRREGSRALACSSCRALNGNHPARCSQKRLHTSQIHVGGKYVATNGPAASQRRAQPSSGVQRNFLATLRASSAVRIE